MMLAANAYGQAQRRPADVMNAEAKPYPISTEGSQLQWFLMSGAIGRPATTAPGGMVSTEMLKIPEPAIKEMQKFLKDFQAGKLDDSVKHATKAIKIYPGWAAAHHNLGQTYARMGDFDKAIVEFQAAAELDTGQTRSWLGLSKVLFLQKRYAEGETAARRAQQIDPANDEVSYFLARNLVSNGEDTPEAIELLERCKEHHAAARLVLANVYLKRGAVSDAVSELRGYVAQPDSQGKEKVQCMVRKLTEPEGTVNCVMR